MQSKAGKPSWSSMALRHCTSTEHLWNRKLVYLTSSVCSEIFLPRSHRSCIIFMLIHHCYIIIIIIIIIIVIIVIIKMYWSDWRHYRNSAVALYTVRVINASEILVSRAKSTEWMSVDEQLELWSEADQWTSSSDCECHCVGWMAMVISVWWMQSAGHSDAVA